MNRRLKTFRKISSRNTTRQRQTSFVHPVRLRCFSWPRPLSMYRTSARYCKPYYHHIMIKLLNEMCSPGGSTDNFIFSIGCNFLGRILLHYKPIIMHELVVFPKGHLIKFTLAPIPLVVEKTKCFRSLIFSVNHQNCRRLTDPRHGLLGWQR